MSIIFFNNCQLDQCSRHCEPCATLHTHQLVTTRVLYICLRLQPVSRVQSFRPITSCAYVLAPLAAAIVVTPCVQYRVLLSELRPRAVVMSHASILAQDAMSNSLHID